MNEITIVLADDHNVLREGIAQVLESQSDMTVLAQAKDGAEAIALITKLQPTIALLDINMPEQNGVQVTREIQRTSSETKVIILTMYKTSEYVFDAVKAGALGYLLKEAEMKELLEAVRAVARGDAVLDSAIAQKVLDEFRKPAGEKEARPEEVDDLKLQDKNILTLIGQGYSNAEIAQELSFAEKTVRNRLTQIFKQLHIKNRTEAALYAVKKGLSKPDED
jgi:DNA-binding NarL/FixJ family response regulator